MADLREAIHGGREWQKRIVDPSSYADVVCADVNDAWYPPSPAVLETLAAWSWTVNHSPDTTCRMLIDALGESLGVDADAIAVGSGSSDLLHEFVSCLAVPGGEVVVTDPTYAEYARSAAGVGAGVVPVALRAEEGFVVAPGRVLERVTGATRLIALCNPNNPTGLLIPREDVRRIVAQVPSNVFVLVDEAYIDYGPGESVAAEAAELPNLVVVRTFSKAYAMAGLRVGYAVMGENVRQRFATRVRPPWPVPMISMAAARTALREPEYVRRRVAETLALKKEMLCGLQGVEGLQFVESGTHYFLVGTGETSLRAPEVVEALRRKGVYVRDCAGFGKSMGERWVRITTQGREANARIVTGLRELIEGRATV
jgi:histidinol-phosphate aminotransferase